MTIPATPTEMQAFIVEQLLQDGPAPEDNTASKTLVKFSKQFGAEMEASLRDKIFHEIQVNCSGTEKSEFQKFSETENSQAPVSLLKQHDGQVTGILRCDGAMRATLSRLMFGGDLGNPITPSDKPATEVEIGLQDIFAKFLNQSLGQTAMLECGNSQTFSVEEFDSDELDSGNSITCRYEIIAGELKCNVEIAVLDTIVERVSNSMSATAEPSANEPNFELMQSKVDAKVKLKPVSVPLKSIQNLKVGDHLSLGPGGNLKGVFEVNGQSVYDCDIGRSGETYCLKISERIGPKEAVPHTQSSVG